MSNPSQNFTKVMKDSKKKIRKKKENILINEWTMDYEMCILMYLYYRLSLA